MLIDDKEYGELVKMAKYAGLRYLNDPSEGLAALHDAIIEETEQQGPDALLLKKNIITRLYSRVKDRRRYNKVRANKHGQTDVETVSAAEKAVETVSKADLRAAIAALRFPDRFVLEAYLLGFNSVECESGSNVPAITWRGRLRAAKARLADKLRPLI